MSRRENTEINAGSMADIAFLLLIFFLVTTTLDIDTGIMRKIAEKQDNPPIVEFNKKNVLEIVINGKNELMVEEEKIALNKLKKITIDFIDNGGGTDLQNNICDWCQGQKNPASSDHPSKAFIALQTNRTASYETYITVMNHLLSAYGDLRNKLSVKTYGITFDKLNELYKKSDKKKFKLKEKIDFIKQKYPLLISDVENVY